MGDGRNRSDGRARRSVPLRYHGAVGATPHTQVLNFIGGRFTAPRSDRWLDRVEPATGGPLGRVADSNGSDVDEAVGAARAAFPAWASLGAEGRSRLLLRLADLIEANLERLALAETTDSGKPIALSRALDIPRAAANFRFFATAVLHGPGPGGAGEFYETESPAPAPPDGPRAPAPSHRALNYTLRRARGVAGLISPWNLPLYLLSWKVAPALATGNTVIAKPSELTPTTASLLAELSIEAGLPPGVLNIVHGRGTGAGSALVSHPEVPTISFTGSTAVGRWIGQTCGQLLKRVSLELGGKNPFVIFDDADLEQAVATAARAGFSNQGQICLCGSRLLVHEPVLSRVRDRLVERAGALRIGDPLDPSTEQGALVSRAHLDKVESYVRLARELGGTIHCGGAPVPPSALPDRCRAGCFYPPTVISGLDPGCRVEQEEIFGPVVTIQPFRDEAHALALANGTPYGLAATVFSGDAGRALRMADRIEAGIVWVNCWLVRDLRTPFGGVRQSGVGREGGTEALRFFTEPKNVCARP